MSRPSDELIARYKRLLARYGIRTAAGLVLAWDQLGSYSDSDVERFVSQTEPLIRGAKVATVAASAAFFAQARRLQPFGINPDEVIVEARMRDPFLAMWHAVAEGRPNDEALLAGRSMAEAVGHNFVVSTARRTSDHAAKQSKQRVRWARVPAAKACEFCITVSGQTYHSAESADFGHDRCSCAVVPA